MDANVTIVQPWLLEHWPIISDFCKAVVFLGTVCWGAKRYREEKEKDRRKLEEERSKDRAAKTLASAEKLHELFSSFYLNKDFDELRIILDFDRDYKSKLENALTKSLDAAALDSLTNDEKIQLSCLDKLLNYLEFISHLVKKGLLREDDQDAIFHYWFELILRPERKKLHEYIDKFGYEAITNSLKEHAQRRPAKHR